MLLYSCSVEYSMLFFILWLQQLVFLRKRSHYYSSSQKDTWNSSPAQYLLFSGQLCHNFSSNINADIRPQMNQENSESQVLTHTLVSKIICWYFTDFLWHVEKLTRNTEKLQSCLSEGRSNTRWEKISASIGDREQAAGSKYSWRLCQHALTTNTQY